MKSGRIASEAYNRTMQKLVSVVALGVAPLLAVAAQQPALGTRTALVIERAGLRFKDLNRNDSLDVYEDWRRPASARAQDLVRRMTLAEKAGMMMHGTARAVGPMSMAGVGAQYDATANRVLIDSGHVASMITRLRAAPSELAEQNNALQAIAEGTRLGIPLTISTDPRHHFQYVLGASVQSGRFSQWPEPLGFAALGDAALMRRFGDIARREYRAVGIQATLSPQADLATEPRWSRINGTFGEDAGLAGRMVRAYVEGFQHGARGVASDGVLAVVKHWVGYGAAKLGFDSHNSYGRLASFPSNNLAYHVKPFLGAFAANVAGVMPTYSILEGATIDGKPVEAVGAGFNKQLLNDELRGRHHFSGIILTDWSVTKDCGPRCVEGMPPGQRPTFDNVAMPWGVENLAKEDRFAKAVNAGVDQFGGTEEAQYVVAAVRSGKISEARVDSSAYRVAMLKFRQALFENPYVDASRANSVVGTPALQREGTRAQQRALVLLENGRKILPLTRAVKRVYLRGVDAKVASEYGLTVVSDPAQADVAIVRVDAPFETLHPGYVFGAMQHEGDLGYRDDNKDLVAIREISAKVPTIVTVYLDRPAILTALRGVATALVANFGVSDAALLDVLTGRAKPEGRLPFELPSSMSEVEAQKSDVPRDTKRPLYPFGFGLRY